ncbi:hypothetical protein DIC82_05565 [Clostridium beijerinckii]|nr:hypothetical protein DIC82_05565 [Clostridium beijerinckii]
MRKNINKLVAVAIGVSVMSGSIMPVFAADSTSQKTATVKTSTQAKIKPVLTLSDAIDAGISGNDKINLQIKKINLEKDKLDIQEDIDDDGYLYDSQEVKVKQEEQNKDFLEDQISQNITNLYNDLVTQEKNLDKLKKQIEIKTKEINDAHLKQSLGLITSIDMKSSQIELDTLKNNETKAENKLKNSQDYLKVLTSKDLNNYVLEQDADYEVFRINGSVDNYLDKVVEKYCEYDKDSSDLLKDYIKDLKSNDIDVPQQSEFSDEVASVVGVNGEKVGTVTTETANEKYQNAVASYKTFLETKYNSSAASVGVEEKKKSYKKILNESYTSLLDLENQINVMKSNIEVNNKNLRNAKLKLDLGLLTKTQYNSQVLANGDLETNLRTLIDNYNKLKNNIQKPWLINN